MFELEIVSCTVRDERVVRPAPPNDEVVRAESVAIPDTLRFVSIALDKVAVPDTVRLRVIRALPDTSRVVVGILPIPNRIPDISPCKKGAVETVEYTRKVLGFVMAYGASIGLLPRTSALEKVLLDPALHPIKIPELPLLNLPALVPIPIILLPSFDHAAFEPIAITLSPEFVVQAAFPTAITPEPILDHPVT